MNWGFVRAGRRRVYSIMMDATWFAPCTETTLQPSGPNLGSTGLSLSWKLAMSSLAVGALAQGRATTLLCQRLLAVGTDMAVGKMSACLALRDAAMEQGLPCRFVGTGQAGILISGTGVPLDAVRVDYAAGAVEAAVLQAAEGLSPEGLVVVEGQGSLCHPGSTATLPLMRGSQPTDLLLVHRAVHLFEQAVSDIVLLAILNGFNPVLHRPRLFLPLRPGHRP